MRHHWLLDPNIIYLNHGSFGATPRVVLERQSEVRRQMEREPVRFMVRELEPLLDESRRAFADFLNADFDGLAFVPNATAGVNAVLRSLDLDKHDELLVTNHEYNASRNVLDYVAALSGARVVCVDIPFPIESAERVVELIRSAVTGRTRLLLIDHVISQTALIFPVAEIVRELQSRGIDTLVDGAHAPGMLPLDLRALDAAYYTGNLHKWVCAPKGAAFLYVRENRRGSIRPTSISHGANSSRRDRSRFLIEFDWTGTFDPSAWIAAGEALRFVPSLVEGGWPEIRRRNHELVLAGRDILCEALGIDRPAPDSMIGSIASVPLPENANESLQDQLLFEHNIEVPVIPWADKSLLRISAQLYNEQHEYESLARALRSLLMS